MWKLIEIVLIVGFWPFALSDTVVEFVPKDSRISIEVNETFRFGDINFYEHYQLPANSVIAINLSAPADLWSVGFGILQVHSFLHSIELSAKGGKKEKWVVNGTNVGLNVYQNGSYILCSDPNDGNVSVIVALVLYKRAAAIPGACNMVKPVEETPFLDVALQEETITVDTPPAGSGSPRRKNSKCTTENIFYEFRYLSLTKKDFNKKHYFEALKDLMVPRTALERGHLVTKLPEYNLRHIYARYAAMGLFFTALVMDGYGENVTTAYVPGHSFGCTDQQLHQDCHIIENTAFVLLLVFLMVIGACQIILGRQLVYLRIIISSFMIGGYLAYVIFCSVEDWDLKMVIITVGGVIFAISWTILWLQCHSVTEVADILASIINGYTLSCVFLYWVGDWSMMESQINYWMLFSVFVFSVSILSFPLSRRGAIVNSALQGAIYLSITLLFMFDGNLQYAIINNWRRLKEASFTTAVINPHLDLVDQFCVVIWIMAVVSSIFIQTRIVEGDCSFFGRPSTRPRRYRDEEVQPLIARLTARELGSDDVFLSPRSNSRFMARFKSYTLTPENR